MTSYIAEGQNVKNQITTIFNNEKAAIPIGFDQHDLMKEAPPLFDDIFNVMFLRQLTKLGFGFNAVFSTISYMKDVNDVFKLNYDISNKYYMITTNYLMGKGVLARPPYVTIPQKAEFIEDIKYMSGLNILSDKRALNTIEVGFINQAFEVEIWVMQLLTGFAQVARERKVKEYFIKGKELSKKVISSLSDIFLQSDIQPPSSWAGKVTDSILPPFSDKLMMYINSLISCTDLGFTGLGTSFSMRNDLPVKLAIISKDVFDYAREGSKIMIAHKWMEEPPQMEDRNELSKKK